MKVIHGNNARRKQKLQLHLKSMLRTYSSNSFGDRRDHSRSSSQLMEISPIHRSKSPNAKQNCFSGTLLTQKSTFVGGREDAEYGGTRTNLNNIPEQQNNITNLKSKTVKSSPNKVPQTIHDDLKNFPAFFSPVSPEKNNVDKSLIMKDGVVLDIPYNGTDKCYENLSSKEATSLLSSDLTYCGLDIPNITKGKSFDELTSYGIEEDSSEKENSSEIDYSETFLTSAGFVEKMRRRRLRNQVIRFLLT